MAFLGVGQNPFLRIPIASLVSVLNDGVKAVWAIKAVADSFIENGRQCKRFAEHAQLVLKMIESQFPMSEVLGLGRTTTFIEYVSVLVLLTPTIY
jgi:hypothetical protein